MYPNTFKNPDKLKTSNMIPLTINTMPIRNDNKPNIKVFLLI